MYFSSIIIHLPQAARAAVCGQYHINFLPKKHSITVWGIDQVQEKLERIAEG